MALHFTGPYRYPQPRAAWLALRREEIIEPDLPILDAHHHIWRQEGNIYELSDLAADTVSGHRIIGTIFVEAHANYRADGPDELKPVGETEAIVAKLATRPDLDAAGLCRGIVGKVDLTLGAAAEAVITAHLAAAPHRFKGVRHLVTRDPHFPDGIALRPSPEGLLKRLDFRDGLATVARMGLTFDAMLYHSQLSDLVEAARLLPDLTIVVDHFGAPLGVGPYQTRRQDVFSQWTASLADLAACPNVVMKMGGQGMIISGDFWHERPAPPSSDDLRKAWQPLFDAAVDAFGASRLMFESNFPVDKGMFAYPVVWNAFKRLASGASADEKAALFHDTAERIYRL